MNLMVIDLIREDSGALWPACLDFIKAHCQDDPLFGNYLNIDLSEYLSFPVVVANGRIIAFSGAQYKPALWGESVARVSTRMWIHPEHRATSLHKINPKARHWFNSEFCIPHQAHVLFSKYPKVRAMFISREGHRRSFAQYIKLVNVHCHFPFEVLPGSFFVCGPDHKTQSCNQFIAAAHLQTCDVGAVIKGALIEATT